MADKALNAARDTADAAEAAAKVNVEAAQAELATRKAAATSAGEALAAAQAAVVAQKEVLSECKRSTSREEHEHKKLEAADKAGAKVMARLEKSRSEAAAMLERVSEKCSADAVEACLQEAKADPVLIAAVPSVLCKAAAERSGFDQQVMASLQDFLGKQLALAVVEVEDEKARQADVHAEAVGAFALMDLAKEKVLEATTQLKDAEAAVSSCRAALREANEAVHEQDASMTDGRIEVLNREEKATQCRDALSLFKRLEAGPEPATADVEMGTEAAA